MIDWLIFFSEAFLHGNLQAGQKGVVNTKYGQDIIGVPPGQVNYRLPIDEYQNVGYGVNPPTQVGVGVHGELGASYAGSPTYGGSTPTTFPSSPPPQNISPPTPPSTISTGTIGTPIVVIPPSTSTPMTITGTGFTGRPNPLTR